MGLFAGARSSTVMFSEGSSDPERETRLPDALADDEAVVRVGDELLESSLDCLTTIVHPVPPP